MNLSHVLLAALREHGAREIFGIPGDFALPFFAEVERLGILPLHTLSHEPGVGFAADAAARYRGGLGVAAVTYGAGALNMVNAVAGSYAERVPVVVISGAPAAHEAASGFQLHHQVKTLDSQWRIYREITVDQARLDDAGQAPAQIARVLHNAIRHSKPVYVEVPRDMTGVPCEPVRPLPGLRPDADAVAACADEVLGRLRVAQRPVLMVGVEVRRYGLERQVAELARRLNLPTVTSFMGRGLLAGADAPVIGTYLGVAGEARVTSEVEDSDGLLLLGVIISDTNFAVSQRRIDLRHTIQAIESEVRLGHHVYPQIPLGALVDALLERVPAASGRRPVPPPAPPIAGCLEDDAPVTPRDIACALNDLLAREGRRPVVSDVGDCLFTGLDLAPTALLAPGYYAGMGYGVPAALGLQAATGERPIVLVGDGAFQMTGWELGNARRHGSDPIVVVFNNGAWEMLRAFQPQSRFNDLGHWDFASMAAGMGGQGHRVATRRELVQALREACATRGRFQLIDVRLAPGAMSDTLSRFVNGVKRLSMPAS
ncbi:MAG: indolepyruvate/phenylpyruvate decarboxylase [Pseudomonadota bacterium]